MRMFLLLFVALFLGGCSTYATNPYSISADDVVALRSISVKGVDVGAFTATKPGLSRIMCRAVGPITTPSGVPFSQYIRKAFVDELKIAEKYSPHSSTVLSGNLDSIDFSSERGLWHLVLTVSSSNGRSISVSENYAYATSFFGETACNQTAQALMPATQALMGKMIHNPGFPGLLR